MSAILNGGQSSMISINQLKPGDVFQIYRDGKKILLQLMDCPIFRDEYVFAKPTQVGNHRLIVLFPEDEVLLIQEWRGATVSLESVSGSGSVREGI